MALWDESTTDDALAEFERRAVTWRAGWPLDRRRHPMNNDDTQDEMDIVQISGRSSSHFTRLTLIFAHGAPTSRATPKGRLGFEGALRWLDDHLAGALDALPSPRDLSLFEVALFCLVDHIAFRGTLPLQPYPALMRFAEAFAGRASAQRTQYRFDPPPA